MGGSLALEHSLGKGHRTKTWSRGTVGHRDTLRGCGGHVGFREEWGFRRGKGLRRMGTERKGQRAWTVSMEDSDPP